MTPSTVIVTGASKGLGRELALCFARDGHRVLGLYSRDEAAAARTGADLAAAGANSRLWRLDVAMAGTELEECPEAQGTGPLVLINNAHPSFVPTPFHQLGWDDFERGLGIGVQGGWRCARALLRPLLRRGQGAIVNVLTTAVHGLPPKGFAAYAVAKHALRGLTLALAAEYSGRGLRVFSVSPGFLRTPLTDAWDPRLVEAILRTTPAADPADVARRIRDLVADPALPGAGEDYPV